MLSFEAGQQRVAQGLLLGFVERAIAPVGDLEHVLGALAEGGDARVVHAQPLFAQGLGHVGEQAGAIGADLSTVRGRAASCLW